MAQDPKEAVTGYESPEIFELGNVEELTFGPSPNSQPDAHDMADYPDPTPC